MNKVEIEKELVELYIKFTDSKLAQLVISKNEVSARLARLRNEYDVIQAKIDSFEIEDIDIQKEFYQVCNSDRFGDSKAFKAWEHKFGPTSTKY